VLWTGIQQYKENNEKVLRNEIYKLRYDTYLELVNCTAHLANYDKDSTSSRGFQKKCVDFYRLYTGKLNMTMDSTLNQSVFNFKTDLAYYKIKTSPVTQSDLQAGAQKIALICNRLLQQTWSADLDELLTLNEQ
jgi:hypothetical protein